jgi:hypothetical protein
MIDIFNLLHKGKYYSYTAVTSDIWMTDFKSFTYPKNAECEYALYLTRI